MISKSGNEQNPMSEAESTSIIHSVWLTVKMARFHLRNEGESARCVAESQLWGKNCKHSSARAPQIVQVEKILIFCSKKKKKDIRKHPMLTQVTPKILLQLWKITRSCSWNASGTNLCTSFITPFIYQFINLCRIHSDGVSYCKVETLLLCGKVRWKYLINLQVNPHEKIL